MEDSESFESYINKILYKKFYNDQKIMEIKKRICMNFFTCQELKYIIFNI